MISNQVTCEQGFLAFLAFDFPHGIIRVRTLTRTNPPVFLGNLDVTPTSDMMSAENGMILFSKPKTTGPKVSDNLNETFVLMNYRWKEASVSVYVVVTD